MRPHVYVPISYQALSVHYRRDACEAVRRLAGKRFLLKEAPSLPLHGCTAEHCRCGYVHHPDRRSGEERRSGLRSLYGMPIRDRRMGRGRRWHDKFPSSDALIRGR